jgi:hypothetical protein
LRSILAKSDHFHGDIELTHTNVGTAADWGFCLQNILPSQATSFPSCTNPDFETSRDDDSENLR